MTRVVKMSTLLLIVVTVFAIVLGLFTTPEFSSYTNKIYDFGGALRVFQSQDQCFNSTDFTQTSLNSNNTISCHFATLQGRRQYQEDRLFCDLNIRIPFYGENRVKEVSVGMAAVFDGHGGAVASEMASKLVLDYFLQNSRLIQSETEERIGVVPDESMHLGIIKEALVRTIRDIDTTFTKEASKKGIYGGSTAAIVIVADNQILVANVGDSKVILCSDDSNKLHSPQDIIAKVLTRDHHPDREDERRRIEAAGGFVLALPSNVPRVIGRLAVSRAIGDLDYKRWGVIAEPEVSDWQQLSKNDRYLVISSDGIFESLNAQQVCQLLPANPHNVLPTSDGEPGLLELDSLPQHILRTAYEKGSMDNLSVILLPLKEAALV